jgi:hypothetical protein
MLLAETFLVKTVTVHLLNDTFKTCQCGRVVKVTASHVKGSRFNSWSWWVDSAFRPNLIYNCRPAAKVI